MRNKPIQVLRKIAFIAFYIIVLTTNLSAQDLGYIRKSLCKYYALDEQKLDEWRNDSTGCNGKRSNYIKKIFDNKMLIGMPKSIFFIFFGAPNKIEKEDKCIYFVTIDCDKNKKQIPDTEYYYLVVEFKDNKVELIIERVT